MCPLVQGTGRLSSMREVAGAPLEGATLPGASPPGPPLQQVAGSRLCQQSQRSPGWEGYAEEEGLAGEAGDRTQEDVHSRRGGGGGSWFWKKGHLPHQNMAAPPTGLVSSTEP